MSATTERTSERTEQVDSILDYDEERINPCYDDDENEAEFYLYKFGLLDY